MRVATWNVNGIRAVERKGLLPWQALDGIDVWCLQETKAHRDQVSPAVTEADGWHSYWFSAQRKGYSGVAIYSREEPDEIIEGMGDATYDDEGRVIAARFGDAVIISAYFPNSQDAGKRIDYKIGFCEQMVEFLTEQRALKRGVLLCGDYNIAHQAIDLARPKQNEGNPGYLPEEREWMGSFLDLGYHDIFREEHPDLTDAYTWWSYRQRARENNVGWRIDYTCSCPGLRSRLRDCRIHCEVLGSDHCPVSVELDA